MESYIMVAVDIICAIAGILLYLKIGREKNISGKTDLMYAIWAACIITRLLLAVLFSLS